MTKIRPAGVQRGQERDRCESRMSNGRTKRLASLLFAIGLATFSSPVDEANAAARSRGSKKCDRAGRTLDATGRVRVYRLGPKEERRILACWLPTRRPHLLYKEPGESRVPQPTLLLAVAGRRVALGSTVCDDSSCSVVAALVDGKTGKTLKESQARAGEVVSVRVNRAGAVIYGLDMGPLQPDLFAIGILTDTKDTLVASASDIDPRSIAITDKMGYWTQGGLATSTPLDG